MEALQRWDWPGNVRELRNVVQRAFIVACGGDLAAASLPSPLRVSAPGKRKPAKAGGAATRSSSAKKTPRKKR
jgi:DNA-binding NtrC family response regulator